MSGGLIPPGGGERPFDLFYAIKLDTEAMAIQQSDHTPGVAEPPPHIHRHHADLFYVLDGDLGFRLGDEEHVLQKGGVIFAPPELVHCYHSDENQGPSRFLNVHAPGMNFADRLRGKQFDFDQHEPGPDGGLPASEGILLHAGEGEKIELGPSARGTIKVGGDDGIGSLTVVEFELDPGSPGPPPHTHAQMLDSFYVLEGTLTVRLGDDLHEAPADSFAYAPPGVVHTVSNPSEEPVRFLGITAPGGLDRYLRELAADPSDFAAIAARHDVIPA